VEASTVCIGAQAGMIVRVMSITVRQGYCSNPRQLGIRSIASWRRNGMGTVQSSAMFPVPKFKAGCVWMYVLYIHSKDGA
jgi:hypothetical protein